MSASAGNDEGCALEGPYQRIVDYEQICRQLGSKRAIADGSREGTMHTMVRCTRWYEVGDRDYGGCRERVGPTDGQDCRSHDVTEPASGSVKNR